MTSDPIDPSAPLDAAHPDWFREPNRREHGIACALFIGFGIFFAALAWLERGSVLGWIVMALAVASIIHGTRHGLSLRKGKSAT